MADMADMAVISGGYGGYGGYFWRIMSNITPPLSTKRSKEPGLWQNSGEILAELLGGATLSKGKKVRQNIP